MVQTGPAVQMMRELLTAQEVTGLEADMWLTSLAFVAVPTRDMLVQAKVDNSSYTSFIPRK